MIMFNHAPFNIPRLSLMLKRYFFRRNDELLHLHIRHSPTPPTHKIDTCTDHLYTCDSPYSFVMDLRAHANQSCISQHTQNIDVLRLCPYEFRCCYIFWSRDFARMYTTRSLCRLFIQRNLVLWETSNHLSFPTPCACPSYPWCIVCYHIYDHNMWYDLWLSQAVKIGTW
jgi:hypothetical protein